MYDFKRWQGCESSAQCGLSPEDTRATDKGEIVDCLRMIAAEARKVYSRIIDQLSRKLVVNRSVRDAQNEAMNIFGPATFAVMLSVLVPERLGLSPMARSLVIHSTSARLNATAS